jgi:copper homeostasis protein CutC
MVRDGEHALTEIISMGFARILTSGQDTSALEGADAIARYVELVRSLYSD